MTVDDQLDQTHNITMGWLESFIIFARYAPAGRVEFDGRVIYAGPDPQDISFVDKARLLELGWLPSTVTNNFYRANHLPGTLVAG